ncbi:MAG: cache domain-containing protein [Pseudomonadota bacterium]
MKTGPSIFMKILVVILPLVSVPIIVVGYLSVRAAEDRVNRLARQEQMLKLEAAAKKINDVFYNFRSDLETLASLPVLEDYYLAKSFRLEAEEEFNRDNIVRIFTDFMNRTPYYHLISCLDREARPLVDVGAREEPAKFSSPGLDEFIRGPHDAAGRVGLYFSEALFSPGRDGFIIQAAGPFFSGFKEVAGFVVIDLDLDRIIQQVNSIKVGESGYAFLVDKDGRVIVHPRYQPYELNRDNISDPSLVRMVQAMTEGGTGWDTYVFEEQEKVAAYAPIPALNWSLAVTIPSEELRREARAIRTNVIQAAALALVLTVTAVSVLSYHLLGPVRRLVNATHRIAQGDLSHEIPVKSRDELGELTASFNNMVKNLSRIQNELVRSEKLISLGRLSAGVAHEIRNPLNAMKAAVVFLRRRRSDDPLIVEYTGLVSEEIDRLNRFVTEFLYFAKQAPPRTSPTDLNRLVQTVESLLEEQARSTGAYFLNHLDPDLPPVELDPHQIEQVLINLFNNALEAMPEGGPITVSTVRLTGGAGASSGDETVRLTIHDSGTGVRAEHLSNLFDPFFTTKETGTGLGLTLSLGIVESHGGNINITGRLGGGAAVQVELPIKGA